MAIKSVYVLQIVLADPVVFYVGCTNDINRRAREHELNSHNPEHPEYNTYKYQTIRDIEAAGLTWEMQVEVLSAEIDEDSEYWHILEYARRNSAAGVKFIDDLPLTNMKAGDFLHEMLQDKSVNTPAAVKQFLDNKRQQREINYQRDQISNPAARGILDKLKTDWQPKIEERKLKEKRHGERKQRQEQRERELKQIREQQAADWRRSTGQE